MKIAGPCFWAGAAGFALATAIALAAWAPWAQPPSGTHGSGSDAELLARLRSQEPGAKHRAPELAESESRLEHATEIPVKMSLNE